MTHPLAPKRWIVKQGHHEVGVGHLPRHAGAVEDTDAGSHAHPLFGELGDGRTQLHPVVIANRGTAIGPEEGLAGQSAVDCDNLLALLKSVPTRRRGQMGPAWLVAFDRAPAIARAYLRSLVDQPEHNSASLPTSSNGSSTGGRSSALTSRHDSRGPRSAALPGGEKTL